ncbi:MAG: carboxypeptidase-like regulatory domain-containing protein [Chitinophagaceae bacterium]|nr:MAG: carboxypeptidase-like regulatory domain-containing protein [Chitinophagaceae bacterium]
MRLLFLLFFLFSTSIIHANTGSNSGKIIQFSGVIMSSDSLIGLPYTHIIIKNKLRGTASNAEGVFSFVAETGDTIIFSALGYNDEKYVIPENLDEKRYSIIKLMTRDTVHLSETIVYPWPTKEQFREAFLSLDLPDDDLERAKRNLDREILREMGAAMTMDPRENQSYYLRREAEKFYYAGQRPPMNIFNPFAWAKFIEAWQNGDFRRD